ncbi:SulP family inorganic anion transporter [Streptomyces sp. NPDC005953]|uniref:SulP family inorganic anion transporter n=1 Tax=Streptomyces sp. NPDC005953 TaxID=3156719 RepID=UPI0033E9800E
MSTDTTSPNAGKHAKKGAATPAKGTASPSLTSALSTDFSASIVVFLVALPLCIGVAAASGVPVALGIISGIVGGLIVGFLPGSNLQVSGPAAGLAVLVLEFVTEHGVGMLGPVVFISGILQMILGMLKLGRMFQSISLSVVQGMLAGIGVPLILSQMYALVDSKQLGTALKNLAGLPNLVSDVLGDRDKGAALILGVMALVICFMWKKVPAPISKVPAPLVAVILGAIIAAFPGFDGVKKVSFGSMIDAVNFIGPSQLGQLFDPAILMMIVTFTVIASAESLFSAAAVDRMHTGAPTKYNAELFSQGVGNTVCGLLGALPMTAVIVRSAANVQAGAKTKLSRILHGAWLLGFGLLLPGLLGLIPITVLAGVLLQAGWKLFNPPAFLAMWKKDRAEGAIMFITTLAIVVTNLLDGVVAGLAVAIILTAIRMSHMTIRTTTDGDMGRLELKGNVTFLRLPKLIDALETIQDKERVYIDGSGISHLDMACRAQIEEFAEQRRKAGAEHVECILPGDPTVQKVDEVVVPDEPVTEEFDTPVKDTQQQPAQPTPYAPDPAPAPAFQHTAHTAAPNYGHAHVAHGSPYARQHQHAQQHQHNNQHPHAPQHPQHTQNQHPQHVQHAQNQHAHPQHTQYQYPQYPHPEQNYPHAPQHPNHQYGMGGQGPVRPLHQQPQYSQHSQVHIPNQAHGPQHNGVHNGQQPAPHDGQQQMPPQGYAPPPGYGPQETPYQGTPMVQGYGPQGYQQPPQGGYWGPNDDWAVQQQHDEGTRR